MEIISASDVNGAVMHCVMLCRELARRGHEVTLVCRPGAWFAPQLENDGVFIVPSNLDRWPPRELLRVAAIARQRDITAVHTHMSRAHAFGVLLRMRTGIPCVATAHSLHIQLHWMLNSFVIATSDAAIRFHRRYNLVRRDRSAVVHNFISEEIFRAVPDSARNAIRAEFGVADEEILLGQVGDIVTHKGLLYLVRAMPLILARVPRVRLVVIGSAKQYVKKSVEYLSQIRAEADRLGVAGAIIWAGHRRDIPDVLSALDIIVSASLRESLPMSILEAMAAGKPVVATRVGGLSEAVEAGLTGCLVPPAQHRPLADAIVALALNPDQRRQFGVAGRQRVAAHFSLSETTSQIEEIFKRVVSVDSPDQTAPKELS
ncbi:MAG: glycosyltransferase family 4 protein [Thermodesulfovibrionales bacterium]